MAMVVSSKRRIYFQLEGERGAFVLLLHGLLGSHEDWYRAGYVEELAPEFRLIIPDLRGHGRSDRTTNPADYVLPAFAEDMVEILNALNVRNTHVLGYSLGALVGFELLLRFRDRVRASALGGEAPFVTEPAQAHWRALAAGLVADAGPAPEAAAPETPPPAGLAALADWPLPTAERYGVYAPVTLFCGAHDPAAERIELAARRIARARFLSLSEADHEELFAQRERLLGQLKPLFKAGVRGSEVNAAGRGAREPARHPREEQPEDAPPPRPTKPVLDIRELERERAARLRAGVAAVPVQPPPAAPVAASAPAPGESPEWGEAAAEAEDTAERPEWDDAAEDADGTEARPEWDDVAEEPDESAEGEHEAEGDAPERKRDDGAG